MKQKVVLMGATGLIGAATLAPLLKSFHVQGICRQVPEDKIENVEYLELDLQNTDAVTDFFQRERPTHLIHAAWARAGSAGLWNAPENDHWVDLSEMLIKCFHQYGGIRAVICGSCAEYVATDTPLRETGGLVDEASGYGAAKVELYRRINQFASQSGLSFVWPRIFFVYGPGENEQRLVPAVIQSLVVGRQTLCTHGNQVRDYAFVNDIGEGLVRLLKSSYNGAINLASGNATTLREVIHKIGTILNRSDLIELGALPARADEPPCIVADTRKLEEVLGWRPATDLETGLRETISFQKRRIAR